MTRRRGAGEGSIYRRGDGRWVAEVPVGRGSRSKRARRYLYASSRAEVARRLAEALDALKHGISPLDDRLTVAAYLSDWLVSVRPTIRPRTWRSYEGHVRLWIVPSVGGFSLTRLGPAQVRKLLATVVAAGRKAATSERVHATLRAALGQAQRDGLVLRNVAELVAPPRVPQAEVRPLDAEQARLFVESIRGDRLEALYLSALGTGLRQGELLGLRWEEVDLDAAVLVVRHVLERRDGEYVLSEPKSGKTRVVPLPALIVTELREHRRRQAEEKLARRREWQEHKLVFTTATGRPLAGSTVTHALQRHLERAGLPRQRFHDFRHFAGTAIVAGTGDLRLAQEILGHSSPTLTANVYAHVLPEHRRRAARAIEDALNPAVPVTVPVKSGAPGLD
jgi:integrase